MAKGGHGSAAAHGDRSHCDRCRTILALQTIASREVKPQEMAVVTVGYILAGTKNNIIPDQAEMGLTVRTNKPEVRKQVLAAITRITNAEAESRGRAAAAGNRSPGRSDLVYNDPALAQRMRGVLESALGKGEVVSQEPIPAPRIFLTSWSREFRDFILAWGERTRRSTRKRKLVGRCCLRTTLAFRTGCGSGAPYRYCGGGSRAEESAEVMGSTAIPQCRNVSDGAD